MKQKGKPTVDFNTFGISHRRYQNILNNKKHRPLCELWRYNKREWLKEINKMNGFIIYLYTLYDLNKEVIKRDERKFQEEIAELNKKRENAGKYFLSILKQKEKDLKKSKLTKEQREKELLNITSRTSDLILSSENYYNNKINKLNQQLKIKKQIENIDFYIDDYKRKVVYGLCHLDLDIETSKDIWNSFKTTCNNSKARDYNLYKKSKIAK